MSHKFQKKSQSLPDNASSLRTLQQHRHNKIKLYLHNVRSLWPLCTLRDFERNFLPFVQCFETFSLNGAEVDEYVTSIVGSDETVALGCVEPFYCAVAFQIMLPPNKKLSSDTI
jgi:hypothetical protein